MSEKLKQEEIPGARPKRIKEIVDCAEKVKEYQDERMEAADNEKKEREKLLRLMKEHKQDTYQIDDEYQVEVEHTDEKAYVRKIKKGRKKKAKKE